MASAAGARTGGGPALWDSGGEGAAAKAGFLYLLRNPAAPGGALKVGRTSDTGRRLGQYPKESRYLEVFGPVEDCHLAERHLIRAMRARFLSSDYGREYFQGAAAEVQPYFHEFCYDGLQREHMQWMPVPMDAAPAERAGAAAA